MKRGDCCLPAMGRSLFRIPRYGLRGFHPPAGKRAAAGCYSGYAPADPGSAVTGARSFGRMLERGVCDSAHPEVTAAIEDSARRFAVRGRRGGYGEAAVAFGWTDPGSRWCLSLSFSSRCFAESVRRHLQFEPNYVSTAQRPIWRGRGILDLPARRLQRRSSTAGCRPSNRSLTRSLDKSRRGPSRRLLHRA